MNNGFGHLPVCRGYKSSIFAAVIIVVLFFLLYIYQTYVEGREDFGVTMFLLCISIVVMFLGELLRRTCLLVEEVCHKQARYEGSCMRVFRKVLTVNNPYFGDIAIFILFLIIGFVAYHTYSENILAISAEYGFHYLWLLLFLNITIVPTFGYLVGIKSPTDMERSDMKEKNDKNLADGLAWSYYFGYLKLVLPHIQKQVDRSNQELREKIYPLKLLILLPRDCFCYKSLSECDSRIQSHTNLPPLSVNRAGVQKRHYHNTVYKITMSKGDPSVDMNQYEGEYYCLVEYATPLLSLYDMSKHLKAGFSEEERLEQVKIFLNKLTKILDDDRDCKGKFQLIPLADTCNDLAMVIVKSIKNCPVDVLPEKTDPN